MTAISRKSARDLLSHLVAQLSDPPSEYERYRGLYDNGPTPRRQGRDVNTIRNLLFTSMRTEVFELFNTPNLKPKMETDLTPQETLSIRSKAGDISKPERGVYLHMIEGMDNTWRFYVGQSENVSYRIRRQHQNFRYRRDHPSFHNFAMQKSRWDHFVILAVLPPDSPTASRFSQQEQALLLNMLEMWCALLFCTLQPDTMARWHEYGAGAGAGKPWLGLNLACPLDQGGQAKFVNWRHALSESPDPLANDYVVEVLNAKREMTPGRGVIFGLMAGVVFATLLVASLQPTRGVPRRR